MLEKIREGYRKHPRAWIVGLVLAGMATAAAGMTALERPARPAPGPPAARATFAVRQGPLTIGVLEAGTISARDQVIIKSEVEGTTSILWLIDEGTRVKKGELLLELDVSGLQNGLIDEQIRVQNSEASYIRARENLDVVKNQAESDLDKAELALRFAGEDLKKYQEGEYPNELKEAESRISLAREELSRAREKLKWSKVLFEEQYLSQAELQADELAAKKAGLDLELARNNLELLKDFTYSRKLAELESNVRQATMAVERTRRKARADVVQAEAELRARESELERQKAKLAKVQDQIKKARIYAPADGLVIYATTARSSWRGNAEPLAVGQPVKERQELIYLPKTSSMQAEIKLHEANLSKVQEGLPVVVTVDALPERSFRGRVASISPLPDAASMWLNPDLKVYNTIIHLEEDTTGLRTGMSCQAEILVHQFEQAVYVPVQAVLRVEGRPSVWVRRGEQFRRQPVETGLDNSRMVRIVQGLEPGEQVLLNPPLAAGEMREKPPAGRGGGLQSS